jgi:diaminopimelate epimerase
VNVEFMEIINPQKIALRVWERGVGETPACGSGACAAVIIGRSWKLLDPIVTVTLPGGTLLVEYQDPTSSVFLTGNAEQIFTGVYGL